MVKFLLNPKLIASGLSMAAIFLAIWWIWHKGYVNCQIETYAKNSAAVIESIEIRDEVEHEILTLPDIERNARLMQWCRDCK